MPELQGQSLKEAAEEIAVRLGKPSRETIQELVKLRDEWEEGLPVAADGALLATRISW